MDLKVVFVTGGPGAGKTTICSALVTNRPEKFSSIDIEDILRSEVSNTESKWAHDIKEDKKKGLITASKEATVGVVDTYLSGLSKRIRKNIILLDGQYDDMKYARCLTSARLPSSIFR